MSILKIQEEDYNSLVKRAAKFEELEKAWFDNQNNDTIFFLRACKEIIEDFKGDKRVKMS